MRYLVLLGRNPKLSIEELRAYFEKTNNKILNQKLVENALLIELEKEIEKNLIEKLGGTISIGKIICKISELEKYEIYESSKNNFNYLLWNYSKDYEKVEDYLKKRFKKEKLKATSKPVNQNLKSQEGDNFQNTYSKLIDEEYFVFDDLFGKIIQKTNYKKQEFEDMNKPTRRESLSISPRLAKILINLSKAKENEILADAFCGVGVILEKALNQNIKVIGIDLDKKAIESAKQNLKWFGFSKDNYELINGDSSKIKIKNVTSLVSEPDFGETLKKIPTKDKANFMIKKFENLMINVRNNLKENIEKRFVFTAPLIRIGKKRVGCNFERICKKTNLKLAKNFPIEEFRKNQIVGRHIVVLEKP